MTDGSDRSSARYAAADIDFGDLVNVLHEGVWIIDLDGVTIYANPRMAEILGTAPDDMLDRSVLEYFFEQDHAVLLERMRSRLTGDRSDYPARLKRADGELAYVRVHGSPVYRHGQIVASVAAVSDITDLHHAAVGTEAALQEAETSRQSRTQLMSWVAHELRTPLNTISGFAQLLRSSNLPPRDQDRVNNIIAASAHVNGLVQDLLDYTRAEAVAIQTDLEPLAIDEVLDEAVSLVAGAAQQQRVHIDRAPSGLWVTADRRKLVGVLINLLSNAVKYGGADKVVTVGIKAAGDRVECSVTDQGPGITVRHQRTIFQPFERLDNAEGIHGTGLGLAIADAYVRAMQGSLSLESAPSAGTTFTVDLPSAERPDATRAVEDASPSPDMNSSERIILYVEDEPLNASLLESIVSLLPGRVLRVEPTVAGGIAATHSITPALVLLDLNLPDGSGFDVLVAIRNNPDLAGTPVFILSADATEQATSRAHELGADRFITKPFDLEQFLSLLDHHTR